MKKWIALSIPLVLLFLSGCMKTLTKDSVLHVIQAPNGQIVTGDDIDYRLTLDEPHDTVIWFADRPVREAGFVHIHDFLNAWNRGKDSFEKDPPNAVLIVGNNEPIVVELILVSWNQTRAIFKIKLVKGEDVELTEMKGHVSLFIDTSDTPIKEEQED